MFASVKIITNSKGNTLSAPSAAVVTVDGKPRRKIKKGEGISSGVSLTELAYFMQSLGAADALNFDGGGSTTMVINGSVVNRPVNGYEQSVSNAIAIKPRSTF
jgi:exopolysaccharide biosynthesis protein